MPAAFGQLAQTHLGMPALAPFKVSENRKMFLRVSILLLQPQRLAVRAGAVSCARAEGPPLSLIHISEPTRLALI
eukprot:9613242-Alexandrium_andersonii.AAC.1